MLKMMSGLVVAAALMTATTGFAADADKVKQKASETADATGEYVRENREEFMRDMNKNLASLEANIADLKAQASTASENARKQLSRHISSLETKRDEMKKDLSKLSSSSGRAWDRMKSGVERAWGEVKTAYNSAASEFEKEADTKTEKQ